MTTPDHETFPNAPIDEAVVEFRVLCEDGAGPGPLERAVAALRPEYPDAQARVELQGTFGVGADGKTVVNAQTRELGLLLRSLDGRWVVFPQVRAVSVSRVRPYTNWADLEDRVRRVWGVYEPMTRPVAVSRIGVRFINRVLIPESPMLLGDWFNSGVRLADGISDRLSEFSFRTVLADEEGRPQAVVGMATQPRDDKGRTPVIFDIDVFADVTLRSDDPAIWLHLGRLRDAKNMIFFRSVTERTKEMLR